MVNEVLIGSRGYTVDVVPGVIFNGQQVQAMIDHETSSIMIDERLGDKTKPHALMHEIVHGILCSGGWHKADDNEQLVDYVAEHIVLLIRQNPQLIDYIQRSGVLDVETRRIVKQLTKAHSK